MSIRRTFGRRTAERPKLHPVPAPGTRPVVLAAFDALPAGGSLVVVAEHDPDALRHELDATRAGRFEWRYLDAGPELWRVRVVRL